MVMTSVIYDDMLITGRSLDGKMSFKFTAENTEYSSITDEKPQNIMDFVKEKIYDMLDVALQDLTNNEEIWADISEKMMFMENNLPEASRLGEVFTNTVVTKRSTKVIYEEITKSLVHQKISAAYEDYKNPYNEYEYDVKVHYHFPSKGQKEGKMDYQLELTTDGKTTFWK